MKPSLSCLPRLHALPYEFEKKRSSAYLDVITFYLYVGAESHDDRDALGGAVGPFISYWTAELNTYLQMKFEIPLDVNTRLCQYYFDFVNSATELSSVELGLNTLRSLLKARRRTDTTASLFIPVDWQRGMKTLHCLISPRNSSFTGDLFRTTSVLATMTDVFRHFVDPSCLEEVFADILSLLKAGSTIQPFSVITALLCLIPDMPRQEPFPTTSPIKLLPLCFHLCKVLPNSCNVRKLELLWRLVKSCECSSNLVNYAAYGFMDKEQAEYTFTLILKVLDIPFTADSKGKSFTTQISSLQMDSAAERIAELIVCQLGSDPRSGMLNLLRLLINTVESYCHPSTSSHCTYNIINFVVGLVSTFSYRWNRQVTGESCVPSDRWLSAEVKDQFVGMLCNAVFFAIHSKSKSIAQLALKALQQMAWLCPDLIIPRALKESYLSLRSPYEIHRTLTAFSVFSHLCRVIAQSKIYAVHITTLIECAVAAIDANDLVKTNSALNFVEIAAMIVPFCDLSGELEDNVAVQHLPLILDELMEKGRMPIESADFYKSVLQSSTYAFGDIASSLFHQILIVLESLPDHSKQKHTPEFEVTNNVTNTIAAVLRSSSTQIYDSLLDHMLTFITTHVIEPATETIARICCAFVEVNSEKCFSKFFSLLNVKIRFEILENSAGLSRVKSHREAALIWYLTILNMCLLSAGTELLGARNEIGDLIKFLRNNIRGPVVSYVSDILHHTIMTLVSVYCKDFRISPQRERINLDLWAKEITFENLQAEWHCPTVEEIEFALQLYDTHARLSISNIEKSIDAIEVGGRWDKKQKEVILHNLTILRGITSAVAPLVDQTSVEGSVTTACDECEELEKNDDVGFSLISASRARLYSFYGFAWYKDSPSYKKVHRTRKLVGEVLHHLAVKLSQNVEDDIEVIKEYLRVTKSWLVDAGIERTARAESHLKQIYRYESQIFKRPGLHKTLPRCVMARRAHLYHLQLMSYVSCVRKITLLELKIIKDLVVLAFSIFPEIRKMAESTLYSASKVLYRAKSIIYSNAVSQLAVFMAKKDFKKTKAGLLLFNYRAMSRIVRFDVRHFYRFFQILMDSVIVDDHELNSIAFNLFNSHIRQLLKAPLPTIGKCSVSMTSGSLLRPNKQEELQTARIQISKLIEMRKIRRDAALEQLHLIVNNCLKSSIAGLHWRAGVLHCAVYCMTSAILQFEITDRIMSELAVACLNPHPQIRNLGLLGIRNIFYKIFWICQTSEDYSFCRIDTDDDEYQQTNEILLETDDADFERLIYAENEAVEPHLFTDPGLPNPLFGEQDGKCYGWLLLPKKLKVRKSGDFCFLSQHPQKERDAVNSLGQFFTKEWLDGFLALQRLEPRDEEDRFNILAASTMRYLVIFVGSGCTALSLKDILLAFEAGKDMKDRNWHRSSAELAFAMLQSAPFLRGNDAQYVIEVLSEIFELILEQGLAHDNVIFWRTFIRLGFSGIDHRRAWPLIEKMTRRHLSEFKSLQTCLVASLHSELISVKNWTYNRGLMDVAENLWKQFNHPLQGVRMEVSHQLSMIASTRYHKSYRTIGQLINDNLESGSLGCRGYELGEIFGATLKQKIDRIMATWPSSNNNYHNSEGQSLASCHFAAESVMNLLQTLLNKPFATALVPLLHSHILPLLTIAASQKNDNELVTITSKVFHRLSNLVVPLDFVSEYLQALRYFMNKGTWHQKIRLLSLTHAVYFNHLFCMRQDERKYSVDTVLIALEDGQPEVRNLAADILSSFVHCAPVGEQSGLISEITTKYTAILEKKSSVTNRTSRRHAAVLGLGALVRVSRFSSPPLSWVPQILVTLAVNAAGEGGLIEKSVTKILGDFKKAREDSWHIDQTVFTREQLDDLEGVLRKSYFV